MKKRLEKSGNYVREKSGNPGLYVGTATETGGKPTIQFRSFKFHGPSYLK